MDFAVNKLKLARAIAETTAENNGKPQDEATVKERYIALGGLLVEEHADKTEAPRKIMAPKSKTPEKPVKKSKE